MKTNVYPVPNSTGIPTGIHFTPTVNEKRGHQTIVGPGRVLLFLEKDINFLISEYLILWTFSQILVLYCSS